MTDTDAPPPGESGDEAQDAPDYKSPMEQFLERFPIGPFGFFQNFAKNMSQGGGGSGQFEFSPEEMEQVRKEFIAEAVALDKMRKASNQMVSQLTVLAGDPASRKHHEAALAHFKLLLQAVEQQYEFATSFVHGIDSALGRKTSEDELTADGFAKTSRDVSA